MKPQIEFYKKELERLEKFVTEKKDLTREEIIRWIGECASLFVFLNVPHPVVQGFISIFENYFEGRDRGEVTTWVNRSSTPNRIKNLLYINTAFEIAKSNVNKLIEQDGLVKRALIEVLKGDQRCFNIVSGLESMEGAYGVEDADSLASYAQAVLESTCNISKKLSKLKDIHQKLDTIKKDPQMRRLFGTQDWLLDSFLNIYKPIRNKMIIHKKTIFPYTSPIPMAVAVGYGFLVLVFIDMALARNKLFRLSGTKI